LKSFFSTIAASVTGADGATPKPTHFEVIFKKMFLNKKLNQRMPKNPLKDIANKRRELL